MSTPEGPNPPHDTPPEQPAWGRQPSGGWGQGGRPSEDVDPLRAVPPPGWDGQPGWGRPGHAEQERYNQEQYDRGRREQGRDEQGPDDAPPRYGGQDRYGDQEQYGPEQTQRWTGPADPTPAAARSGQSGQQDWRPAPGQPLDPWPGRPLGSPPWGPDYPPLPEPIRRPGRTSSRPLILGGAAVVVVAVVAILGFVAPGFLVTRVFDTAAVQAGVERILTDDYGLSNVTSVTCGQDIQVTNGTSFTCTATIDGTERTVPVRVTSNDGDYEVGQPL